VQKWKVVSLKGKWDKLASNPVLQTEEISPGFIQKWMTTSRPDYLWRWMSRNDALKQCCLASQQALIGQLRLKHWSPHRLTCLRITYPRIVSSINTA